MGFSFIFNIAPGPVFYVVAGFVLAVFGRLAYAYLVTRANKKAPKDAS